MSFFNEWLARFGPARSLARSLPQIKSVELWYAPRFFLNVWRVLARRGPTKQKKNENYVLLVRARTDFAFRAFRVGAVHEIDQNTGGRAYPLEGVSAGP